MDPAGVLPNPINKKEREGRNERGDKGRDSPGLHVHNNGAQNNGAATAQAAPQTPLAAQIGDANAAGGVANAGQTD